MSVTVAFLIMASVYLAPNLTPRMRLLCGFACIVAAVVVVLEVRA